MERLSQYGAVSVETAVAMAETAREILGADYGLSTTGVAGPDQLDGEPIGTVFTALSTPGGPLVKRWHFAPGSREVVKRRSAYAALGLYWRHT